MSVDIKNILLVVMAAARWLSATMFPCWGELPLKLNIREDVDKGVPTVVADPDSDVSAIYRSIARKVGAQLALTKVTSSLSISISEDE
ncbi:hypothetical protein SVI_2577 [Shewanella violacea DSS12]|uniref:Uncharacterized protein n=1 Tax=Shewanella violacea (strain JCM 10179 / CIP 106290 / LMG 19151 / DSS12) TaxID=637905 RepID=D4ZLJ9_SHEVD|nr:hypothetical protein SVI_2577 [Shewanella violacea DSS12]